jgi:hypothetical protein
MSKAWDFETADKVEKPGYHITEIPKGPVGTLNKVLEEVCEAIDSQEQGAKVMVYLELSDAIGAIQEYLLEQQTDLTIYDLIAMSDVTRRAFKNGTRS